MLTFWPRGLFLFLFLFCSRSFFLSTTSERHSLVHRHFYSRRQFSFQILNWFPFNSQNNVMCKIKIFSPFRPVLLIQSTVVYKRSTFTTDTHHSWLLPLIIITWRAGGGAGTSGGYKAPAVAVRQFNVNYNIFLNLVTVGKLHWFLIFICSMRRN